MADNMVLCIARQFGSGGRQIGLELADKMGIQFYDKELLKTAAQKSGILQELFEKNDEKPVRGLLPTVSDFPGKMPTFSDYVAYLPSDQIQNVVAEVIREAADKGPCVIIGRCADYILRGNKNAISVFIHADIETRINRIARLHNLDEDGARSLVRKTDRARSNYYSFYTDRDWGSSDNYHLAVDAGHLGLEKSVEIIKHAALLFCDNTP